jgi:lipopolysaccharide/colanic/teichoic acid biosynthesis glycosyltransferase
MNVEFGKLNSASYKRRNTSSTTWRARSTILKIRALLSLIALDCIAVFGGFAVASMLRGMLAADAAWLVFAVVLTPVYVVVASNMRAYAGENIQNPFVAMRLGLQALALAICVMIIVVFYLKTSQVFPRLTIALGSVLSVGFLTTGRYFFVRHLTTIVGGNPFSVFLILDGNQPMPVGDFSMVIAADSHFDPDAHDPAMYDRLARSLSDADRVVVSCPPERRLAWVSALRGANIQSELLMPELEALKPLGLGLDHGKPTIIVAHGPLNLVDRGIKRVFDLVVASVALIVLSPVLVLVALIVKIDSPGPIFFKQTRIGRANQLFKMYKFRSMRVDGCDQQGARSTSRTDERVTRVGRFIRSTSIDELPQLLNVLVGHMSIVGPRPHATGSRAADKLFWEVDHRYWHRHAAKPGLTGLAQVRGFRGATLEESDLTNRLQADLEYLDTWSIWRDLKIILLTVRVLLHRNAF